MAASVRIEDEAFVDTRVELLGALAGYNRYEALGRLAHLWRVCTQRETYVLEELWVVACLGDKGPAALVQSGLGVKEGAGYRIKGTEGRIEWLQTRREASRAGGEAFRAKMAAKRGAKAGQTTPSGAQVAAEPGPNGGHVASAERPNAPSPSASPTPCLPSEDFPPNPPPGGATGTEPPKAIVPAELNTEAFRAAWGLWKAERAAKRIKPYTARGEGEALRKLAPFGPAAAIAAINDSIAQGWQGLFPERHQARSPPIAPPPKATDSLYDQLREKFGTPESQQPTTGTE